MFPLLSSPNREKFSPSDIDVAISRKAGYSLYMETIKVYRNGSLSLGEHSAEVQQAWTPYDSVRPSGRAGRLNSLYASPSIAGVTRWVRGNHMILGHVTDADLTTHEITVNNAEEIYVYSIKSYDRSFKSSGVKPEGAIAYWESGIRLSEWEEKAAELGLDATEWEVLLPVENIKGSKTVSNARLLKAAGSDFDRDLMKADFARRSRLC
jgi:hypothetical protein